MGCILQYFISEKNISDSRFLNIYQCSSHFFISPKLSWQINCMREVKSAHHSTYVPLLLLNIIHISAVSQRLKLDAKCLKSAAQTLSVTHFSPVDEALFGLFWKNSWVSNSLKLRICLEIRCLSSSVISVGALT